MALLVQRIYTLIRRAGEPGVRLLHTDKGGELASHSLQQFCDWKGIIHTITDTAQHESNGLVERKIGILGESVRAAMTCSNLPAHLSPEVYMAMCHTQNLTPSSALEREGKRRLRKQAQSEFEAEQQDQQAAEGEENAQQGETRGLKKKRDEAEGPVVPDMPVRDMIP